MKISTIKKNRIQVKLAAIFFGASILPLGIFAAVSWSLGSRVLEDEERAYTERLTKDALSRLERSAGRIRRRIEERLTAQATLLRGLSESDVLSTLAEELRPAPAPGQWTAGTSTTQGISSRCASGLGRLVETVGLEDFLLIQADGRIAFALRRREDMGKTVASSSLAGSALARAWRRAQLSEGVALEDASREPSEGAGDDGGSMFLSLRSARESGAVLAGELSLRSIGAIVEEELGIARSQRVLLVGADGRQRLALARAPGGGSSQAAWALSSSSQPAAAALEGRAGSGRFPAAGGKDQALAAYAPVRFGDRVWAIVAEVDPREVVAPIEEVHERIARARNRFRTTAAICLLSILAVAAAGAYAFGPLVLSRLREGAGFAEAIALGDLTRKLDQSWDDELGTLTEALNRMASNLREVISAIVTSARAIATSSSELSATAASIAMSADDTREATAGVASGAEEMATHMATAASAVEEIETSLRVVSASVREMEEAATAILRECRQALDAVKEARRAGETATGKIEALSESAREIGNVMDVIVDIAERTDLLALNARIEAARGGEAGKGFAIVANEVKDLARQTASATGEIRERIQAIQKTVPEAASTVATMAGMIERLSASFGTVVATVEQGSSMTKEIASNLTQVSAGATDVSRNVNQAAAASKDIAARIARVLEQTESQAASAETTSDSARELARLSEGLKSLTTQFKV